MLDYKDIITKHYALGMSGGKIAESLHVCILRRPVADRAVPSGR